VPAQSGPALHDEGRVEQLTRALADAVEQQAATSQVLEIIGRSEFELEPVFETLVRHAVRLCGADASVAYQLDGDVYRIAFAVGASRAYREYVERNPIARDDAGTLVGRVGVERRAVQIPDVLVDPGYQWHTGRELAGFRTILGVPMIAGDRVVGVLTLWREEVDPFGDRTIDLLTTFAAQAAIAIQNVQLFGDLTDSVDELRALGEISAAVSSSLDLDQVLTTIVTRAVQLSRTEGGSIFEFDQASKLFHVRTFYGTEPHLAAALTAARIHLDETFIGRAASSGEPLHAPDLELEPPDPHVDHLLRAGWRSMLAVPLLWEQEIIGALIVRRKVPGVFSGRTAELLETLASQSAVAIRHARVFGQLRDKTQQLEVASRHKSEFLASMSHELRTPLNAVIGFSDVLLERMFGELSERQDKYIREIRDSGHHLLELINEILDISKVEAGRMELEMAPVPVGPVLEDGLAMVRERAGNHRISLKLEGERDLVVLADELRLKQVVLNLLTNAVKFTAAKFTDDAGEIAAGGEVTVAASRVREEVRVTIRDNGIGIAESDRQRIFETFEQAGRRTSDEGTGLGLTLCKRIVELHGGSIGVLESEPGVGSTLEFTIPVPRASLEPAAAVPTPAIVAPTPPARGAVSPAADPCTVVVIDDDPTELDLVEAMLAPEGYAVVRASNGDEGVRLVREAHPGVVLLDLLMPGIDGFEVVGDVARGRRDCRGSDPRADPQGADARRP